MGWTVNQPMWCQCQHSRAAVVVPAGASPAYKPEPSPSRYTCCPQEGCSAVTSKNSASANGVHGQRDASLRFCSILRKDCKHCRERAAGNCGGALRAETPSKGSRWQETAGAFESWLVDGMISASQDSPLIWKGSGNVVRKISLSCGNFRVVAGIRDRKCTKTLLRFVGSSKRAPQHGRPNRQGD